VDPEGIDRKLAAILSADVVGYGRLMAADEVATVQTLTSYRGQLTRLIQAHRGRVVDSPGDNLLAEFPSALDATQCAVEIQGALQGMNADVPTERRMEFRIGVHLGDVMLTDDRIYGDGVNIAARLEGLAAPGGITISSSVYDQVRRKLALSYENLGEQYVKNQPEPIHVYRIRLGHEPAATAAPGGSGADALKGLSGRPDIAVLVIPAVWVFYVAIVFEILFMISPFALYYYSSYGPSLNLLHYSPWTAWLTDFFLPHFSRTSSAALNQVHGLGAAFLTAGSVVFVVSFIQIYTAKILRRGAVTGGVYGFLRHTQYVALAIVGLGTLLIWPRFLVLVTYISMLFLYGLLARLEEQRCLRKFGSGYREYLARTRRFLLPGLFGKLSRVLPSSGGKRVVAGFLLYGITLGAAVTGGYWLRNYSLSQVSSSFLERMAVLSPAVLSDDELRGAATLAMADARVGRELRAAGPRAKLLVYVVPVEWRIADLPMELRDPNAPRGGHHVPADFDRRLYKVLFTKVRTHHPDATGEAIVRKAYGRDPILLVRVDTGQRRITSIETPPPHVRWGDIPTPLF